jgi:uncharacterized coiled-coil DUF342 family protein
MEIPYEIRKLYARAAEIQARKARLPPEAAEKIAELAKEGGYKSMFDELEEDAIRIQKEIETYRKKADTYRKEAEMADTYRNQADTYRKKAEMADTYKRELDEYHRRYGSL